MKAELQTTNSCILHVNGMHCAACELVIEKKLKKVQGVSFVDAKLASHTVEIKGELKGSPEELAEEFTRLVEKDGYTITVEKHHVKRQINWNEFMYAVPIAFVIIILFILLQKTGLVNIISAESVNLPAAFLIGLVASVSSCAAVVGGLALSISSSFSMAGKKVGTVSSISFHAGRLIGFFILGGVIGWLGSLFTLQGDSQRYWSMGTSLFTGTILFALALGLLTSSDFFKKFTPKLPKSVTNKLLDSHESKINSDTAKTPILAMIIPAAAGLITFFLPCGFTQSMQMFSLGSGSFINGALTMFTFALGTLPVLGLLSFTSVKLSQESKFSGIFFKTAGLLVLFFSIVNLTGALAVAGVISPIFTF